jgi:hypothetical protein
MEEFAKMIYSQWQNEDNTISWDDYNEVIGKLYEILNSKLADNIERTINKRVWKVQENAFIAGFSYACKCLSNDKVNICVDGGKNK